MQTNVELGCLPQYEDNALLLKKKMMNFRRRTWRNWVGANVEASCLRIGPRRVRRHLARFQGRGTFGSPTHCTAKLMYYTNSWTDNLFTMGNGCTVILRGYQQLSSWSSGPHQRTEIMPGTATLASYTQMKKSQTWEKSLPLPPS